MKHSDTSMFGTLAHLGLTFTSTKTYCGLKINHLLNDPSQFVVHRDAEKYYEGLVAWCDKCVTAKPIVELGMLDL